MKIAFVHPSWPGDEGTGATHTATQMVRGLAERNHDVTVYCMAAPPSDTAVNGDLKTKHLDLTGFPYHPDLQLVQALKNRVDEFKRFDVANCYHPSGIPAMEYIGRETSTATGVTLNAYRAICPKNDLLYKDDHQCTHHSLRRCMSCCASSVWDNDESHIIKSTINRLGLMKTVRFNGEGIEHVDFFRAPSEHVKNHHVNFGFPGEKIRTIPHPINPKFLIDHQSEFTDPYKLLYVGSLRERKGVDQLVPMLAQVQEKVEADVFLTVVGNGGQEELMRKQVDNLELSDYVEFAGFVSNDQLPEVYASHDLFVHPSRWEEPFARVYLEAIATGTPVVTRDYGAIGEMLGKSGAVCNGTVSGLAQIIANLINKNQLGEMSRATVEQSKQYSVDNVLDRVEVMYNSATKRGS